MSALRVRGNRSGVAVGDAMIVISVLVLGFALVYPRILQHRFNTRLDQAVADVEVVRAAAQGYWESNGSWPDPAAVGESPPQLAGALPPGFALRSASHSLQWSDFELVQEPPPMDESEATIILPDIPVALPDDFAVDTLPGTPPPTVHAIGALMVHSGEAPLLAGLLERYGDRTSFVHDTTWTLVMPNRSGPRDAN